MSEMECAPLVKDYIDRFLQLDYPALFGAEAKEYVRSLSRGCGTTVSEEVIYETVLSDSGKKCDFSVKVLTGDPRMKEYWLELDEGTGLTDSPCRFIDASFLRPDMDEADMESFFAKELTELAGEERVRCLSPQLKKVLSLLSGRCKSLYQLGAMNGRAQDDRIRVFTERLRLPDISAFLREIGWSGDTEKLEAFLSEIEPFAKTRGMLIDFDIFENSISEKIGINFDLSTYNRPYLEKLLDHLVEKGLCLRDKADEVIAWTYRPPQARPFIINDWSHFKFAFEDGVTAAKVYLRQGSRLKRNFELYDGPALINLELTDRCPLRCPQCYCDLNHGRDMPLETALYWIRNAADCHVDTVNLSGGETFVYPYIEELIAECSRLGLHTNIAISGWGASEEKLRSVIDAGVDQICVSLNACSEEVNALTRDGYRYALAALETLQRLRFPRTAINYVMHSNNAGELPGLVELAEKYDVSELCVMVFKPNAAHELPTVPSAQQMKETAKFIKRYCGKVLISVEPCFSQMKALVSSGVFGCFNKGVQRGCGAGRDGISVSLDGKLTPCRHLEFKENYSSVSDYWKNSPILRELRNVEKHMGAPCDGCRFNHNCLPCAAVNVKLRGEIAMACKECPIP